MESFDAVIVGAGPAGTAAALGLAGLRTLVLDVGTPQSTPCTLPWASLNELKKSGQASFSQILGDQFQSLHNVDKTFRNPKLKAPLISHVVDNQERHFPLRSETFFPALSFAKGGLANAWGAGAYRYLAQDLEDFPISEADLGPYFQFLTELMGISGQSDDLDPYFGSAHGLLPAIEPNETGRSILDSYRRRRAFFHNRGIRMGLARLAVLTRAHGGRPTHGYHGMEFFRPDVASIYNPAQTLNHLAETGRVQYRPGFLVTGFEEKGGTVKVLAQNTRTGESLTLECKRLILAAGALCTSRIVLAAAADFTTRLPLLENPVTYVPFVDVRRIGKKPPEQVLPAQLNVVYDGPLASRPVQATIYGVTSVLWGDLLLDFPLAATAAMSAVKNLSPAMFVLQIFYPGTPRKGNYLRLQENGQMEADYAAEPFGELEQHFIRVFRRSGFLGHRALCRRPDPGASFHYAATLPMKKDPGPFETFPDGRLAGCQNVYIADAANFSALPSKNLTFTIMANALRIAHHIRKQTFPAARKVSG